MSQYQSKFRLDYGKYFDNPPNSVQAPSITGDNNNILNFARTVRNDDTPSGLSTNESKAMIPTTIGDIKAAQSIRDASTKGRKNVQEITKEIGGGITNATGSGITEDLKTVEQTGGAISPDPFPVTVGKTTDSEKAGSMAFSAKSLPAGALAFNNAALERLKKGDNLAKGAGPVTAAAVTALISAAPQIISAIKDYRNSQTKGGRYIEKCEGCGTYKMYVKGLSDDKVKELEELCKKIRGQGRYLSGSGDIGSGKFGTFMSNAWNKLKGIYNSEQFKPIKKALLNAANNTATNYINKTADKVAAKTGNQDIKDIVNVTRDTALNAKDQLLNNTANGAITGGSMIANENVDGENVDGVRLFEESICYDPVESTANTSYTANRLACPRGYLEGAGKCKGYKKGRTTRIAF
jgi:hypothetical protein